MVYWTSAAFSHSICRNIMNYRRGTQVWITLSCWRNHNNIKRRHSGDHIFCCHRTRHKAEMNLGHWTRLTVTCCTELSNIIQAWQFADLHHMMNAGTTSWENIDENNKHLTMLHHCPRCSRGSAQQWCQSTLRLKANRNATRISDARGWDGSFQKTPVKSKSFPTHEMSF